MVLCKKLIYDASNNRLLGYCDFSKIQVEVQNTYATEALVIMLVCLNGKFKCFLNWILPSS